MKTKRIKIDVNTHDILASTVHGTDAKDMIVLHETVSGDQRGLDDINNVIAYLDRIGYGIHGMTDKEAYIAWAVGLGNAVMYHCGGVNERSIGIEQVFKGSTNQPKDKVLWAVRQAQLRASAKLCAAIHNTWDVPLVYSNGLHPGVTSHWDVSQHFAASEGHTDCHPIHKGGYYPILAVIGLAKAYSKTGIHL